MSGTLFGTGITLPAAWGKAEAVGSGDFSVAPGDTWQYGPLGGSGTAGGGYGGGTEQGLVDSPYPNQLLGPNPDPATVSGYPNAASSASPSLATVPGASDIPLANSSSDGVPLATTTAGSDAGGIIGSLLGSLGGGATGSSDGGGNGSSQNGGLSATLSGEIAYRALAFIIGFVLLIMGLVWAMRQR